MATIGHLNRWGLLYMLCVGTTACATTKSDSSSAVSGGRAGAESTGGANASGGQVKGSAGSTAASGGTLSPSNGGVASFAGAANAVAAAGAAGSAWRDLLSSTGLYLADMTTLGAGVVAYTPRFELWSDGATKRRWLYLPEGASIDTTDPDYWMFPVGTKVWKEFSKNGRRIETRLVERTSSRNYRMVAFVWQEDQRDAVAVPLGQVGALGTDHDVPSSNDCETCHLNHPGRILGVGAVQLDYESPELTVEKLATANRLSASVPSARQLPGNAGAQAALGLLHANCGTCHNPRSTLPYKALDLWLRVGTLGSVATTPFYTSAVDVVGGSDLDPAMPPTLVVPGDPAQSALVYRMATRAERVGMPPLGAKRIDDTGVSTISSFIAELK